KSAAGAQAAAMMLIGDPVIASYGLEIVSLASEAALPLFSMYSEYSDAGALMAYGPAGDVLAWCDLRGPNSSRRPAERSAGRATQYLRAGDQSTDGEGARSRASTDGAGPRQQSDRVMSPITRPTCHSGTRPTCHSGARAKTASPESIVVAGDYGFQSSPFPR